MNKFLSLFIVAGTLSVPLQAHSNFCVKCQKLQEYHDEHPSKYTYYEDYKEDVKNGTVTTEEEITVDEVMEDNN
jgi:hypothetical protein